MLLYDPRTNLLSKTTYDDLEGMTGYTRSSLMSYKTRKRKLKTINCYLMDCDDLKQRREWYAKEKYMGESWLTINGSDNQFKISNYGRVKRVFKKSERFMMPYQRKGVGNLFVKAKYNGKYTDHKVGHIVAAHFIREPLPEERVIRKNGIITDDYAGNLKIVTNQELGIRTGHKSNSKAVVQICAETLETVNEYRSAREAGRNYFLSYQAILDRCNGVYKQSDGYIWLFADDYEQKGVGVHGHLSD